VERALVIALGAAAGGGFGIKPCTQESRAVSAKRCAGAATFAAIVDDIRYSAPRERILADVTALLRGLSDRRLLEV
jgi:hypothetical protein